MLLISPLIGLLLSIKYLNWRQVKWVLIAFVTIFGSIVTYNDDADISRYYQRVLEYRDMSIYKFFVVLENIVLLKPQENEPTDVYIHIVTFLCGSVLRAPGSFFVVVSFIFGYFYISGIEKVFNRNLGGKQSVLMIGFSLLLIVHRGVDMMQSIRTWTGMWVLFNGVLGYLDTKRPRYLFLMLLAPLFHLGYFAIALPAYFVILVRSISYRIVVLVYLLSFIINVDPTYFINRISENELGHQKVVGYYREEGFDPVLEQITRNQEDARWYVRYGRTTSVYLGGNIIAFALIIGGIFKNSSARIERDLLKIGLLTAAMANLGDFVYVFYSRTMANAVLFILATIVLLSGRGAFARLVGFRNKIALGMLYLSLIVFIPKIIYTASNVLIYTSVYVLGLPVIGIIWKEMNISIRDLIGIFF